MISAIQRSDCYIHIYSLFYIIFILRMCCTIRFCFLSSLHLLIRTLSLVLPHFSFSLATTCLFSMSGATPHQNITQFILPRFGGIQRQLTVWLLRDKTESFTIKFLPLCSRSSSFFPPARLLFFELHGIRLPSCCSWIFPGFCYFYFTELNVGKGNSVHQFYYTILAQKSPLIFINHKNISIHCADMEICK